MFCSKKALHRLNNIHERSLRLIHQNYKFQISNFNTQKMFIEFLIIKVYKYLNGLSPQIMNNVFKPRKTNSNIINIPLFQSYSRTKWHGLDCIAYRANQILQAFPNGIRLNFAKDSQT